MVFAAVMLADRSRFDLDTPLFKIRECSIFAAAAIGNPRDEWFSVSWAALPEPLPEPLDPAGGSAFRTSIYFCALSLCALRLSLTLSRHIL